MLTKLIIKNIALIDNAEIDFTKGLNVLSGETGSGKSVIIESINFVLGGRADSTLIRSGENECSVIAYFDVSSLNNIKEIYNELDIEYDDTLIISRKFNIDKKNTIKINGLTANVSMVKKFTSLLVDVHGQSEHFELLSENNQLKLIDKFGGEDIDNIKFQLDELHSSYNNIIEKINDLGGDEDKRLIKLDIINFQILEIEKAEIKDGEEEKLLLVKEKLKYQEKIIEALSAVKSAISDEGTCVDILSNSLHLLGSISNLSTEYEDLNNRLNNAYSELEDISDTASILFDKIDQPEYSIDEINTRLDLYKNLKRKYGNNYEEIVSFYNNILKEKSDLENFSVLNEQLLKEKQNLENKLYSLYSDLSKKRKIVAKKISEDILLELKELGMSNASFNINFNDFPTFEQCKFNSSNGIDSLKFMFSANKGEPVKPLSYIISGGEISRFMLSIKVITSKCNEISTFIFDEIDSGISGITARTVAEKLARISKNVQVIAITHLPQISSFADNNLLIQKFEIDGKTKTIVKTLSYEDKINEISRLIGGTLTESSKLHSISLIESADEYKKKL